VAKRKIIKIDEKKCNGCGLCIPNCPEGAIQIIDKKARLISDLFCDGLGACLGHCPKGAITIEEREAEAYDEKKVMSNIVKQGKNVIIAHLKHLKDHGQNDYLKEALDYLKENKISIPFEELHEKVHGGHGGGCPGSRMMDFRNEEPPKESGPVTKGVSQLRQWPIQITLLAPNAPYFQNADLLIAADCVPFAYPDFHQELLKGKALMIGCPKLDDTEAYQEKLTQVFKVSNIKSVTYAHMEVPCCFGLIDVIETAISNSGKKIPFKDITITIKGQKTGG